LDDLGLTPIWASDSIDEETEQFIVEKLIAKSHVSILIKLHSVCLYVTIIKKSTKPLPDILRHIGASKASN
jgi:hypothetical protein